MKKTLKILLALLFVFTSFACTNGNQIVNERAALSTLINEAEQREEWRYTVESWTTFNDALTIAINVRESSNATAVEIVNARVSLEAAITGLVVAVRDRTALRAELELANALTSEVFAPYGFSEFEQIRNAANVVYYNPAATQSTIDATLTVLMEARTLLIAIPVTSQRILNLLTVALVAWQMPLAREERNEFSQLRRNAATVAANNLSTVEERNAAYIELTIFIRGLSPRFVEEGYERAAYPTNYQMITIGNPNFPINNPGGGNANAPAVNRNHDPSIFRDPASGAFYVFATHNLDPVYGGVPGPRARRSTDLINWEHVMIGGLDPTTHTAALAHTNRSTVNLWAPDMIMLDDGRYALYTSLSTFGTNNSAISIVTSDSPTGIFANTALNGDNIVMSSVAGGGPNAIDPAFVRCRENRLWMAYGSFFGGIFITELNPNTGMPFNRNVPGTRIAGGAHTAVEGAYIIFNRLLGYYYLFLSYASLSTEYNIRIARSRNISGPFLDANGRDVRHTSVGGNLVLTSANIPNQGDRVTNFNNVGTKVVGGFDMSLEGDSYTASNIMAPGHNSAIQTPDGRWFIVKHVRARTPISGGHLMHIRQMVFNKDGWPLITPFRYAGESLTQVTADDVVGNYIWINQGAGIRQDPVQGNLIRLNADLTVDMLNPNGTLLRANAGNFLIVSGVNIELEIDGVKSYGFFMPQWDTVNNRQTMTFSTLTALGGVADAEAGISGVSWLGVRQP